jgi:peptidoglycan hydrolase-like protein with peptidoglycan-binding domain
LIFAFVELPSALAVATGRGVALDQTVCPRMRPCIVSVATRRSLVSSSYLLSRTHFFRARHALPSCVATTFKTLLAGVGKADARCSTRLFAFPRSNPRSKEVYMPNPGQPTISPGATGEAVRRLQRALRRTPNLGLIVDGVFGPATETAVKQFQQGAGLVVDGVVGPQTWAALPNGAPMPTLREGSTGAVVKSLQQVLANGAPGQWNTSPGAIDGTFGPATAASVKAFQTWGAVVVDGIVGDQTWAVSLHAADATLESTVGLQYAV